MRNWRRNLTWTSAGNTILAATQWGVFVLVAKFGDLSDAGRLGLALALSSPIFLAMDMKLRSVQASDIEEQFAFCHYIAVRSTTTIVAVALILGLATGLPNLEGTRVILLIVSLAKAVDAMSNVVHGWFQRIGYMEVVAQAIITNGVISLVCVGLGLYVTHSLDRAIWGMVAGSVSGFVFLAARYFPTREALEGGRPRPRAFNRATVRALWLPSRRLVVLSAPLGATLVLSSLRSGVPRYSLAGWAGVPEVGVYTAMTYLMVAGSTVVNAIEQVALPSLARMVRDGRRGIFRSRVLTLVAIGAGLGIAGAVISLIWGGPILTLLYTAEYANHSGVLVLVALGAGLAFGSQFAVSGMIAMRRFREQLPMYVVSLGVSMVASFLLVPHYGINGAAVAVLAASLVQFLASVVIFVGHSGDLAEEANQAETEDSFS